ncbi:MAG: 50S ribosomal protein L10, partial [Thermoplasmata archaeon]
AGDKISKDIATALTKLEIYPLTVGLELKAAYEEGIVFPKETLAIDQSAYLAQVQDCAKAALNLSVYAAIPNRMSIRPLLSKAYMEALSLAVNSEYPTKESIKLLLAKANAQSIAVASRLPADVLDEKTKSMLSNAPPPGGASGGTGEKKEEPKEEKKEEKKVTEEEAAAGLSSLFG